MKTEKKRNWNSSIERQLRMITIGYTLKKRSFKLGYLSKSPIIVSEYNGRYGKGITIQYQTDISNRYHRIEYWIKD